MEEMLHTLVLKDVGIFEVPIKKNTVFYFWINVKSEDSRYTVYTSTDSDKVLVADSVYVNFNQNLHDSLIGLHRFAIDIINTGSVGNIVLQYQVKKLK